MHLDVTPDPQDFGVAFHERRMVFEPVALELVAGQLRSAPQTENKLDHVRHLEEVASREEYTAFTLFVACARAADESEGLYVPVCDYLQLTINEACCLCDVLHGQGERLHGEHAADVLDRAMFDALDFDRRDRAWGVDGQRLLARVVALSPVQAQSLMEAVRVFWSDSSLPISDRLTFVGLLHRQRRTESASEQGRLR